jgi:heme/copper-type cytochrome/quinol oxidase subunit 2
MELILKIHNFFVNKVYAQSLGDKIGSEVGELEGNDSIDSVDSLVDAIVNIAVPVAILCLVVLVVYAGYMLISSQGNPDKIKEGKDVLTNAIIGFFIVVLSIVILVLLSNTLGLGIYNTQP